MDNPANVRSNFWHRFVLAAGFVLVAWFYAWTNDPTKASWRIHGQQSDYYNVLIHGFLKGHLYMDAPVSEELKACPDPWNPAVRGPNCPILQDATYYNGRYYLYYGFAPLTLMLPFRLITGADLPLPLTAVCFAWGALLVGIVLWESIRERYFPAVRPWVGLAAVLIIGVASPLPVLLRRTLVYELPIASGSCFSLAALLALYWSIHSRRSRVAWLATASICLGLAVASRLTFLYALPILLIPVWVMWREQDRRSLSTLPVRALAAAVVPCAMIGALMAVYNYQRFGQFTEFGTKYQVAEMFDLKNPVRFSLVYAPFNLADYLLAPPDLSRHFPFFYFPGTWHSPVQPPPGYWGPELVPGILVCFPICLLAALSIFVGAPGTDPQRSALRAWRWAPWGLFATTAFCLLCYYAGAVRYMVDFTASLMLCAALGLLVLESWLLRSRTLAVKPVGRALWLGLLAVSVAVAVMFSLGVRATFREVDPVGHARVAKFFETLSFWNPRLSRQAGPVEITLRLDQIGAGQSQPVLACGAGQESEEVFLRRPDADHVVVGYRHGLTAQPELGAPIAVQAGRAHRFYLDLGSLYGGPSTDTAGSAGADAPSVATLKKRWSILMEDETVLEGRYHDDQAPTAGNLVFLGCDPNSDEFGKVLVTSVVSARRLPVAEAVTRAANRSSVGLEFKLPRTLGQGSQTLLTVVGAGADLRVEVVYLNNGHAELHFRSDGAEVAPSHAFANDGQWHRLNLDQVAGGAENKIHVRLDRIALTPLPRGRIDFRRAELRPGWGTTPSAAFTGLVRNPFSDSAQAIRLPPRGERTAISVIFPQKPQGTSEPLLVTGRNGAGDFYEVVYGSDGEISFRQDHWGAGILRTSRAFKVKPGAVHQLVFEFVQLAPGATKPGSPAAGGVRLTIDGQRVWEKDAPYNPFKENEVYVGRNEIGGSTCSREFSGEIIAYDANASAASAAKD